MRQLLERLHREQNPKPSDRVCIVGECEKALTAACGIKDGVRLKRKRWGKIIELGIGIERITHHDLRHLFATRCIESGVDIPTVSRWLGHSDGGALAMKTYGHLRREHSAAMAQRVTFGN
jgi:integrase